MNKNDITELARLNSQSHKRVVINDNFVCEFIVPTNIKDWATYYFFTEWYREENCPRETCYADVIVYEHKSFNKHIGRIYLSLDKDIDKCSLSLALKNKKAKKWKTMHSVTKYVIEDSIASVKKFLKLIKFKPKYKVKEPYDCYGLSICQFKNHKKHSAHIEFGIDGRLYYEIIDETNYKDGELIPLDSELRKDVIAYEKITNDNMQQLADKINESLTRLYST